MSGGMEPPKSASAPQAEETKGWRDSGVEGWRDRGMEGSASVGGVRGAVVLDQCLPLTREQVFGAGGWSDFGGWTRKGWGWLSVCIGRRSRKGEGGCFEALLCHDSMAKSVDDTLSAEGEGRQQAAGERGRWRREGGR